jgi:hypothetical protein
MTESHEKILRSIEMTIDISELQSLQPLRTNDMALMHIMSISYLTKNEIKIFNNTRIFVQVTSIVEISTSPGNAIHPSYITINPPRQSPTLNGKSFFLWPHQPPPS